MGEKRQGKVHYVCFYSDPEIEDRITLYPSVISKIDYIVGTVKTTGREVHVVSVAPAAKGCFRGYQKQIDKLESHTYLPSVVHENRILSKLCFVLNQLMILIYLLCSVKKEDTVLVYHSLYNRLWLNLYSRLGRRDVILQIEDVFSELTPENKRFQKMEWNLLRRMNKCICVNDVVYESLQCVPKKIVSYGSYLLPCRYEIPRHDTTRLVYAGVIEQERKAAFLAIEAMAFLPEAYELRVLGFGSEEDISAMEALIGKINTQLGRQAVSYHGRLSGEAYWQFLQSCDLALSTHAYTEESLSSANHTFPSKVLTYLANGLCVVAQKLDVLASSSVSDFFTFYENPNPEEIARAIMAAPVQSGEAPRKAIEDLNTSFIQQMEELLGNA